MLRLTKNNCLLTRLKDVYEIEAFAKWILKIGDWKLSGPNNGKSMIDTPNDILIKDVTNPNLL